MTVHSVAATSSCLFVGTRPEERLFVPPTMERVNGHRPMHKPNGGLWTSPETAPGRSAWLDWCRDEMPAWGRYRRLWRLRAEHPRIYTIDTLGDLKRAIRRWPHQSYPEAPAWSALARMYDIDFVAVARDGYDAVELTDAGQDATRLSMPVDLYGWDCASVLWLRWVFTSVEPVRRRPIRQNGAVTGALVTA